MQTLSGAEGLHLAPVILDAILFLSRPTKGLDRITTRELLKLAAEVNLGKQRVGPHAGC